MDKFRKGNKMDIKKHKSYMEFYYKILSFNDFGEFRKYLKFHYWYYQNSPKEIQTQIDKIYKDLKEKYLSQKNKGVL